MGKGGRGQVGGRINKNIMLAWRSKSKQGHELPSSRAQIDRRRQELLDYNKKFTAFKHPFPTKRTICTADTSPSRQVLSSSSTEYRLKSSRETAATLISTARPKSMQTVRCHGRSSSPLSVFKTHNQCLRQQQADSPSVSSPKLKRNFLRKGSAVDRTLIRNILMSKLNTTASRTTSSYCDAVQNKKMMDLLGRGIPLGLKDVVGTEEMMRMSHIVLGAEFKTKNLNEMIHSALVQRKTDKMVANTEEEDSPMLKSIQRW